MVKFVALDKLYKALNSYRELGKNRPKKCEKIDGDVRIRLHDFELNFMLCWPLIFKFDIRGLLITSFQIEALDY